jgi:hypothetical protein
MAIVRCPRCRDEVTVPPGATSRALVRCPLCLEQYLLSEALANAPPLLVIIGGEVPHAVIDTSPIAGHDYELAAAAVTDSPDNHWGHAAVATLPPRAPTIRAGRLPRKREPNAILLTLSWLGGGILSLVLAPLILWWIFKVDPVEIGPTVAGYAPWVVPQQFHGQASSRPTDIEPVTQPSKRRAKKAPTEKQPTATDRPATANDSQSLPEPAPQSVETPESKSETTAARVEAKKPELPSDVAKNGQPREQNALRRPPMPDLTDLLP